MCLLFRFIIHVVTSFNVLHVNVDCLSVSLYVCMYVCVCMKTPSFLSFCNTVEPL